MYSAVKVRRFGRSLGTSGSGGGGGDLGAAAVEDELRSGSLRSPPLRSSSTAESFAAGWSLCTFCIVWPTLSALVLQ